MISEGDIIRWNLHIQDISLAYQLLSRVIGKAFSLHKSA